MPVVNPNFKAELYQHCLELLRAKIQGLQATLSDLRNSAANETKSTAGDKHETALAMLQIEQENIGRQLKEVLAQKLQLEKIDITVRASSIVQGSLVKSNKGYFFMSVGLGKMQVSGAFVIALSPQSPLGSKLTGSKPDDVVIMNNTSYAIEALH